jgi:hypothetical protein
MGSDLSVPSRIITHADLFKKTAGTRRMVDDIFSYMMYHLKVNDFMKLSNPEGCSKYVLFMANNLSMFFSKLRILPHLGQQGMLAFRDIESLEEPKGDAKKEKESLCLVLAYFYTRIFQIYGAIALTLLDDINYTVEMSSINGARPAPNSSVTYSTVPVPGQIPSYVEARAPAPLRKSEWNGGSQMGGRVEGLRLFDFLNDGVLIERMGSAPAQMPYAVPYGYPQPYMVQPTATAASSPFGYTLAYKYKDFNTKAMFFKSESKDEFGRNAGSTSAQKGIFTWVDSQKKIFEIGVSTRYGIDNTQFIFSVDSIRYRKKGEQTDTSILKDEFRELLLSNNVPEKVTIASTNTFPARYQVQNYETVVAYFKALFDAIVPYVTKQVEAGFGTVSRSGFDALNIRRFYENYSNVKPLGHCIARALQLLNADPYGRDKQGKEFVSSICKTSFFVPEGKTTSERKGIPKPNEPITESPGIMSLTMLFYDTVQQATPQLFMSNPSFQQYVVFMREMTKLFVGKEAAQKLAFDKREIHPKTKQQEQEKIRLTADGKTDVTDQRTFDQSTRKGICSSEEKEKTIPLDPDTTSHVHSVVQSLFDRQARHAAQCEQILRQLFTIHREPNLPVRVQISDRVLQGGLTELNRINAQVRALLIQYYSDCESGYLNGVRMIELQRHRKKSEQELKAKQLEELAKAEAKMKADAMAAQQPVPTAPPMPTQVAQPTAPAKPPVQPTAPAKPPVQPTAPARPPVQPTAPAQPNPNAETIAKVMNAKAKRPRVASNLNPANMIGRLGNRTSRSKVPKPLNQTMKRK